LKFVASQYNSVIPDSGDAPGPYSPNDPLDRDFFTDVNALLRDYINAMDVVKLRLGLQTVMLISNRANAYLQASGLNKALMVSNPKRCALVISRAVNLMYTLSALIYPFMPATSEAILSQLNAPARVVPDVLSNDLLAGHTIGTPEHLFKKIEEKMADIWRAKFGGNDVPASEPKKKGGKKAAPAAGGSKSPEAKAIEAKVAEQGQVIRELKGKTPKTPELEEQIIAAVDVLKAFKADLEKALSQH
jgi:methionyl-tRNA synthetase